MTKCASPKCMNQVDPEIQSFCDAHGGVIAGCLKKIQSFLSFLIIFRPCDIIVSEVKNGLVSDDNFDLFTGGNSCKSTY